MRPRRRRSGRASGFPRGRRTARPRCVSSTVGGSWSPSGDRQRPPEVFVRSVLVEQLKTVELVASDNFRFGRGAVGTIETMQALGERKGFAVAVVPPVMVGGERVSTTRVADCVVAGRAESAAELM